MKIFLLWRSTCTLSLLGLLLLLSGAVSSCGFQLESQKALPPQLHNLALNNLQSDPLISQKIDSTLHSLNIHILPPSQAPFTLNILKSEFTNSLSTLGGSNLARNYAFSATLTFSLTDQGGHIVLPPQTLLSTSSLTLEQGQLLETNNQAELLHHTMTRDLMHQLFHHLSAADTFRALSAHEHQS